MNLYKCKWPNGDVTFVHAKTKQGAIFVLDEIASADEDMISLVAGPRASVFFGFTPCDKAECNDGESNAAHWHLDDADYSEIFFDLLGDPRKALKLREALPKEELVQDPAIPEGNA